MALLGESTEAIRLGAALYNAATTLLIYALGAQLASRRAGLWAGALFALFSASPVIEGFTANAELYMTLPIVAAVLLGWRRKWLSAGVAAALACTIKPTAVCAVGPALAVLLLWERRSNGPWLRCLAGAVGGALPFIAHGVLTDAQLYWYSVVGFRLESHSALSAGESWLRELVQTGPTVLAALAPLWLLAGLGIAGRWRSRAGIAATAFLVGSVAGAALGGYWYWHYYVGLVAPAALLGGLALDRPRSTLSRVTTATLALSVLIATVMTARVIGTSPEETSLRLYARPAYVASREIASYIRERTDHDDAIYAAFAQADLYYLAHRRSAARQLYWTEINRIPGAFEALLATLDDAARRPKYVIKIDDELETPGRADAFWERVARFYVAERSANGFTLFRAIDAVSRS